MIPEARRQAERVAFVSLLAAIGLIAAKLAAALASGSLALLSEAVHSTLDAGATALTLFAVRVSSRPPDKEHPYGHRKAENLSAFIETIALFALSIYIAVKAVGRLGNEGGSATADWYTFAVIILSIVVDASRATILKRQGRLHRSAALQADAMHFTADLLTSIVVLIGLFFVRFGLPQADSIGSLIIAGYIALSSITLGRRSIDVLMDRAPPGAMEKIQEVAAAVPGVEEVRRVRMRYSGGDPQMDVVIAISRNLPLELAHGVTEEVESAIRHIEPGADVVVHVEPYADEALVAEQVRALALRQSGLSEIHNVYVTVHPGGLHISLHAKFPGTMALAQAHGIVEDLERAITTEVPRVERVDTHMEPLEMKDNVGRDATSIHADLVESIERLALSQAEVEDCHDILVTDSEGGLIVVMHCEAAAGLSIEQVHTASTRIEDSVHREWPLVTRVTVHFEPR
ncbi:MAG: cation-efflux pump [Actinomycetota bacterium]